MIVHALLSAKLSELAIALILLSTSLETAIPSKVIEIDNTPELTTMSEKANYVPPSNSDASKAGFSPNNASSVSEESDPKALIIQKSEEYGIDPNLALDLARFESNFNPLAKNPSSTAKGIYQWLDGSWKAHCEGSVTSTKDNVECTMRILANGGLHHWLADSNTKNFLIKKGYVK